MASQEYFKYFDKFCSGKIVIFYPKHDSLDGWIGKKNSFNFLEVVTEIFAKKHQAYAIMI